MQTPPHPRRLLDRSLLRGATRFVLLFAVWLLLDGGGAWEAGLLAAAAATLAGMLLPPAESHRTRLGQLPSFLLFFLVESLRGGMDVAWRALHPGLPVQPHFVDHPLRLPPGLPRTLMVSLVSLLPGSLSADLDADRGVLRVHLLAAGGDAGLRVLEQRIAALFGLALEAPAGATGGGGR